jgi:hypothetical protein
MKQEIKRQKLQHLADLIAEGYPSPWSQSEQAALWPESQFGGDGPWNKYGDDDEEGVPPIAVDVPRAATPIDPAPHDFSNFPF